MGPPHRFGDYEILGKLGHGGMAEVFRARALSGPRAGWTVALKRLLPELARDPAYVELFTTEAELSRWLSHPNIVQVFEVGHLKGTHFMVMEFVDGRDFGQILRRCRSREILLPMDFAVYLACVLLRALEHAHEARAPSGEALGLVHCDVSPSNLFLSRAGEVKLGDFGVARGKMRTGPAAPVAGKPYYLSPEILEGEVTPAADVWAAAVLLYESLTLERPFQGESPEAVFAAIRAKGRVPVAKLRPEVPAGLSDVLTRALHPDPKRRFSRAADLREALSPHYDERVGTPLALAGLVRGLFGAGTP